MNNIRVGLVDDHKLFRKGMRSILSFYPELDVTYEASSGEELLETFIKPIADVLLIDYTMEQMSGPEAAARIIDRFPQIRVLALSMYDDEHHILDMIEHGVNGYLLKDSDPDEIIKAIVTVMEKDIYYTDRVSQIISRSLTNRTRAEIQPPSSVKFNERELQFLNLICKELSHKEISAIMCVSERTIDGYRDRLCEKLKVKNKVGLVRYAVKNGLDYEE